MAKKRWNFKSKFSIPVIQSASKLEEQLILTLNDEDALARIKKMSNLFSNRFESINIAKTEFKGTNTNPFVASALARIFDQTNVHDMSTLYIAGKAVSSIETAAGKIVEAVVPMVYGWKTIESPTNSPLSEIDCMIRRGDEVILAALKSGPACINDSMSGKIASAICNHNNFWFNHFKCTKIRFIVGMNYSSPRNSNKKDWHILRLAEKDPDFGFESKGCSIHSSCIQDDNIAVNNLKVETNNNTLVIQTSHGESFWDLVSGPSCRFATTEICLALANASTGTWELEKLRPWYELFYRHFVDDIVD
ncbi:PmeII family type II restriction endonuclease [Euryarchaeota archaeon]|nr:PmeII family type II restriction endonuclease [Euryarchaeota archaeon]